MSYHSWMNDRSLARSVSVTSEEGGVDWRLRAPVIISTGASPFLVHLPNYLGQLPKIPCGHGTGLTQGWAKLSGACNSERVTPNLRGNDFLGHSGAGTSRPLLPLVRRYVAVDWALIDSFGRQIPERRVSVVSKNGAPISPSDLSADIPIERNHFSVHLPFVSAAPPAANSQIFPLSTVTSMMDRVHLNWLG